MRRRSAAVNRAATRPHTKPSSPPCHPGAVRPELPDPAGYDPVRFPGQAAGEEWPPPFFDFESPRLRDGNLFFERDGAGEVLLVRDCAPLRFLIPIETAHVALDLPAGGRDYRLLRLVPSALRFVERLGADDPMPELLRGGEPPPVADEHVYAATTALVEVLASEAGEAGQVLCEAIRRVPPGQGMFERAVVEGVARGGGSVEGMAALARSLQRLANAHARVLAALAAQPDYAAMERVVVATRAALTRDRVWSSDLLTHGLGTLSGRIGLPRRTVAALRAETVDALRARGSLANFAALARQQDEARNRLINLAVFWSRLVAAWVAVDPVGTDRRDVETLARNAARRLSLAALYLPPRAGLAA